MSVAVAGGPELSVRLGVNGEPAKRPLTGNTLVQPEPVMVMVPDSAKRPSELAADWVRLAEAATVADEVEASVPVKETTCFVR